MKFKTLLIGLFLAAGIISGAQDGMAWNDFPVAKSSIFVEEVFHSCDFKPGVSSETPAGTSTDSSDKETSSDCCSGVPDYDPAAGVRPFACKIQLLAIDPYPLSERLTLLDSSYPINKPPQNQSV